MRSIQTRHDEGGLEEGKEKDEHNAEGDRDEGQCARNSVEDKIGERKDRVMKESITAKEKYVWMICARGKREEECELCSIQSQDFEVK